MSEFINNSAVRIDALTDFSRCLILGENGKMLIEKYRETIENISPMEAMQVLDKILQEGFLTDTVKAYTGKIINCFFKSLSAYQWNKPGKGHFIDYLMLENRELEKVMMEIKSIVKVLFKSEHENLPLLTDQLRAIPEREWIEMLKQSNETGWCYGVNPDINDTPGKIVHTLKGQINLSTGFLKPDQLILLLNNLPVDITFVDEYDEVCYFSGAKHRIFPRSKAIIGRKVQNCHPPESVHIVNEIIAAFRTGKNEHADFWIQMKGRFIHIRYFALRNEQGEYKGTIEVSQDATDVRQLQGERRLLDWDI